MGCFGCLGSIVIIIAISAITNFFSNDSPKKPLQPQQSVQQPTVSPSSQPAQQPTATMKVTVPQFIDIYNKEIKQRHGDKTSLGKGNPVPPGTVIYEIPEGKGSAAIINTNPADGKVTTVTFTIQGNSGEKFDQKSLRAWTASLISATSPGISNDDIIEIRGKILGDSPITMHGIYYMAQYTEKGAPFFQIIARAQ